MKGKNQELAKELMVGPGISIHIQAPPIFIVPWVIFNCWKTQSAGAWQAL